MIESLFWAFLVRTGEALIEASPTILCGVLVAGILRRMAGPAGARQLFGASGWRGLLRAWGMGMLLPVCSLGVIPVARELRRAGISGGNILAFALAAPLLNPISLLYGLTLAEPLTIFCYAGASLVLALVCGLVWQRWFPEADLPDPAEVAAAEAEPTPVPGLRRIVSVGVTAARELVGAPLGYYVVGLVASGLLSAALPHGSLQKTMQHSDPLSPLLMVAIAAPAYMGPLPGMMRIGLMFEHGNSVGAAFVMLVLGVSVNVGLVVWIVRTFGWRPTVGWFALVVGATLAIAYAIEKPLYPTDIPPADHTHAFDDFSSPFTSEVGDGLAVLKHKLTEKAGVLESASLAVLVLLALLGIVERRTGLQPWLEGWLTRSARPNWDVIVPGPLLGVISLGGLVVFSVVSAFIYYPPADELFHEMHRVRAEAVVAVMTGQSDEAIRRLEQWDLLTRKLQVGAFLRSGRYDTVGAKVADDFREVLEKVRDALLVGEHGEAKTLLSKVEAGYQACREAYGG